MNKYLKISFTLLLAVTIIGSCKKDDLPIDEDGLLITARKECFVSNFELLGSDFVTVRSKTAVIDTTAQTINVEVIYGTDLKNVYPQFSLATDCKLTPKIIGKTDLSDLANPKVYTVVSGNRQIRKDYKLIVKFP